MNKNKNTRDNGTLVISISLVVSKKPLFCKNTMLHLQTKSTIWSFLSATYDLFLIFDGFFETQHMVNFRQNYIIFRPLNFSQKKNLQSRLKPPWAQDVFKLKILKPP